MKSYFEKCYDQLKYPIDSKERKGLRNAQNGAIHAIASFFTKNSNENAIVVMPTGTGKTAVLMMSPYILRKRRVLIVTPSKMVRGQIAEDFQLLDTLCKINVLASSVKKPNVFEMEHQYSEDDTKRLQEADVIVATANCALTLSMSEWAKENIDIVLVDEAHHTPAATWKQILNNISSAAHILFTATPFRLDKKEITGEIIYDYPLRKAYEEGVFGEIQYIPVTEAEDNDIAIATIAEEVLVNDRNIGYEHFLMIRTDTKENAKKLENIYNEHTSLKVKRIDSSLSNRNIRTTLDNLKTRELDGIICVDMLGEGYDFPNLKIAAVHVPHKSLASTLQFIGRFARTNADNIGTAKFIAVDDEELEIEKKKLYSRDAIWQDLIVEMSDERNNRELTNREYYKSFSNEVGKGIDDVPIQAIKPNCHVKIYRVEGFNIMGSFPDICNVGDRTMRNSEENTVIGIGLEYEAPLWMGNGERINQQYILYIIHYQDKTGMLHIYSQHHSEVMYEELVQAFCEKYNPIPKYEIFKVLGELNNFEIYNSGMLNKQAQSGESYRIMTGSDVSDAIDRDTGRLYAAGHAFCKATNVNNEEITIGYSSASKVWSSEYKELMEYIKWCDELGLKISNKKLTVKTNTNFDYLPHPKPLLKYPEKIFFVDYNPETYTNVPTVKYCLEKTEKHVYITDMELLVRNSTAEYVDVECRIDEISEIIRCGLKRNYTENTHMIMVSKGNQELSLQDYFTNSPLIFKSVDDMTIIGDEVIEGDYEDDIFDNNIIMGIDWDKYNTDISTEFGESNIPNKVSIQDALFILLNEDESNKFILYDHGTGEIADYITIKENNDEIRVELFHVKRKTAKSYNNSVGDIYEVVGQAMKSVMWFKSKGTFIDRLIERNNGKHAIIKKGDKFNDLIRFLRSSGKILRGNICIVQPGISKGEDISPAVQELLSAVSKYVKRAGKVDNLKILGSK